MTKLQQVVSLFTNPDLVDLVGKYRENLKKQNINIELNLFAIISNIYHRENLHSDVIKVLLDPNSPHSEGPKYFKCFIEYLQSQGVPVDINKYKNVRVEREENRIDILIVDEESKRAIIIENKINGARDMHRQIPGYLESITNKGYHCDAIIYLRLTDYSPPQNRSDWLEDEKNKIDSLLKVICAYNEDGNSSDLLSGWINKCEIISDNEDLKFIFRQYGVLIKKLGGNVMNKPIMDKFYGKIVVERNYETAMLLNTMLRDLIYYRADRITEAFRHDYSPFEQMPGTNNTNEGIWAGFYPLKDGEAIFSMSIAPDQDSYILAFKDCNESGCPQTRAKNILEKMNRLNEFKWNETYFQKTFYFPKQEDEIIPYIREFKENLKAVISPR